MGRRGRQKVEGICANHYAALISLYEEAGSNPAAARSTPTAQSS